MRSNPLALALFGLFAAAAPLHAQIKLRPLGTVDLGSTANPANPEYIGTNPVAVAWNGRDLYVAGFNSAGTAGTTGVVRYADALGAPTAPTSVVQLATPALRGFSGLDIQGDMVAAAFDSGGTDANGITLWDGPNASLTWARSARGGSGVGFDPGFPGGNPALGQGVAWLTFGSGRRPLQDTATGADIWTTANGMIVLTSEGTFWRDVDFDDASGDFYAREGNNVVVWRRSGDNSVTASSLPFNPTDADFVNAQNLAFVRAGSSEVLFFNDRSSTAGGQSFADVVKVIRPDGSVPVVDWGGFTAPDGVGAYDFSYDEASGTLAIVDFSARGAYLFAVEETCSTLVSSGDGQPGTVLTIALSGAAPNAGVVLGFAGVRGATTIPLGSLGTLDLCIAQPIQFETMGTTDGSGDLALALSIPTGLTPRIELVLQAFSVTEPVPGTLDFCVSGVADIAVGQ